MSNLDVEREKTKRTKAICEAAFWIAFFAALVLLGAIGAL